MPVLLTATAIYLLFLRGGDEAGFFAPDLLADRIRSAVPEGEGRDAAAAIADELLELRRSYVATTKAALEDYAGHVESGDFSLASILAIYEPVDSARTEALGELIRLRQALLDLAQDCDVVVSTASEISWQALVCSERLAPA